MTCLARNSPAWILLMAKPSSWGRAHFFHPSLISANFSFLEKPYGQTQQTSSTYLRFYSSCFGTPLNFTCVSRALMERAPRDLLTPHGRVSQNVLGRDNFLIIPPNPACEGIFQPLHFQWWECQGEIRPGVHTFLSPCHFLVCAHVCVCVFPFWC